MKLATPKSNSFGHVMFHIDMIKMGDWGTIFTPMYQLVWPVDPLVIAIHLSIEIGHCQRRNWDGSEPVDKWWNGETIDFVVGKAPNFAG